MIHPSYTELIQAINNNAEEDDNTMMLNSRYSLVLATSKRARQLIAGAEPLVDGAAGKKPLAIAIDELYKGKVKIVAKAKLHRNFSGRSRGNHTGCFRRSCRGDSRDCCRRNNRRK